MTFQLLRPEIENIPRETWNAIKVQWQFRVFILFTLALLIATFVFLKENNDFIWFIIFSIFPLGGYYLIVFNRVADSFWKKLAKLNGWKYEKTGNAENKNGIMFKQGHSRGIYHIIEGEIEGRQFEVFNYNFTVGYGKHRKIYFYTVFTLKFNGSFPHIYLNNKWNKYGVRAGEKLPLPLEFEKNFTLSAPKEYEIEALEIFTNEILTKLLDGKFISDIEFVDQRMVIFTDGIINDVKDIETRIKQALELGDLFDEKLDKFKFQKIGDMSFNL